MQDILQAALQPKGAAPAGPAASTETVPMHEGGMMAPEPQGQDIVAQIQEQLAAIEEALENVQTPKEMQQLVEAKRELEKMLMEMGGAPGAEEAMEF